MLIICPKKFQYKDGLEKHLDQCNNELCSYCGKTKSTFSSSSNFKRHYQSHHSEERSCDTCNTKFDNGTKLKEHIRKVHNDYVQCEECLKTFPHVVDYLLEKLLTKLLRLLTRWSVEECLVADTM